MLLVVISLFTAVRTASQQQSPVVNTYYGAVKGVRSSVSSGVYIDKFLNIPFAQPPIGNLRFRAPEAPAVWSGTRDGTVYGHICPQPHDAYLLPWQVFPQSEDCLYLNVYRPSVSGTIVRLPVMVWIHGGGFVMGTGNRFDWTQLSAKGVVVVTINYRLGALGFLTTEDGASAGNYGLFDQIRALEWVRDVIASFNGDPNKVTIFGESAGSMSVSLLLMSRASRGLFHRAIMESGVSLTPGAMTYLGAPSEARRLATALGCGSGDSSILVSCLRSKDAFAILNATMDNQLDFSPIPETTFGQYGLLPATPAAILQNNWFANVPTIRGFNNAEAAIGVADNLEGLSLPEIEKKVHSVVGKHMMYATFPVDTTIATQNIMYIYFANITDPAALLKAYIQFETDWRFVAPTLLEVDMVTTHEIHPQYVYQFSYRSQHRLNAPWKGAQHVDEIPYITGAPVMDIQALPNFVSNWTDDDRRVSSQLMTLWANFAQYGNPTPSAVYGVRWLPWIQSDHWLEIDTSLTMASHPVTSQQKLLMDLLSQMYFGQHDISPLIG